MSSDVADVIAEEVLRRVRGICRLGAEDRLFNEEDCLRNYVIYFNDDPAYFSDYVREACSALGYTLPEDIDELGTLLLTIREKVVKELENVLGFKKGDISMISR
jgi:tryptophan 2,3-dioxygenase